MHVNTSIYFIMSLYIHNKYTQYTHIYYINKKNNFGYEKLQLIVAQHYLFKLFRTNLIIIIIIIILNDVKLGLLYYNIL